MWGRRSEKMDCRGTERVAWSIEHEEMNVNTEGQPLAEQVGRIQQKISLYKALSCLTLSRILQAFATIMQHLFVNHQWLHPVDMNSQKCLYLLECAIVSKCMWTRTKNGLVVNTRLNGNKGPCRIMMRRGERMRPGLHWLSCLMQVTSTGRMDRVSALLCPYSLNKKQLL